MVFRILPVFDGMSLAAKSEENEARKAAKMKAQQEAEKFFREGQVQKGLDKLRRAAGRSSHATNLLLCSLTVAGFDCWTAPYEADAQMAWMSQQKITDAVLTTDSDLLAFGSRECLFPVFPEKIPGRGGQVDSVILSDLLQAAEITDKRVSLDLFQVYAATLGCDYYGMKAVEKGSKLPGFGRDAAAECIRRYQQRIRGSSGASTIDGYLLEVLEWQRQKLKDRAAELPDGYKEKITRCVHLFRHQTVYDKRTDKFVAVTEIPDIVKKTYGSQKGSMAFLGPRKGTLFNDSKSSDVKLNELMRGVCRGKLDPTTLEPWVVPSWCDLSEADGTPLCRLVDKPQQTISTVPAEKPTYDVQDPLGL